MLAGPYSEDTLWRADTGQMILQPSETVVIAFHKVSGDTHILNFLSTAALNILSASEETFGSAVPKILAEIEMTPEDCPDSLIKSTILELDDLGLVIARAPVIARDPAQ
jgi:hypothetical protein